MVYRLKTLEADMTTVHTYTHTYIHTYTHPRFDRNIFSQNGWWYKNKGVFLLVNKKSHPLLSQTHMFDSNINILSWRSLINIIICIIKIQCLFSPRTTKQDPITFFMIYSKQVFLHNFIFDLDLWPCDLNLRSTITTQFY